jgi:hypothetical protein
MSKIPCKGTKLSVTMSGVLTPVAQIINFDFGDFQQEHFEADTLDNAVPGIPYLPTWRVECGKIAGELFFDPLLASHTALLAIIQATSTSTAVSFPCPCTATFNSTIASTMSFSAVGFGLGGTVALKDGLKAKFNAKITTIPTIS